MHCVLFYHSLVSDWNHGNAHFLRGVVRELRDRGHGVRVLEPEDGWSVSQLRADQGERAVAEFAGAYPGLASETYRLESLDLDRVLEGADLVLVHEWNDPQLVARIGAHRARSGGYALLFHDTHHRAVSQREQMAAYALEEYDGVLAFGGVIRDLYLQAGWARRAWTWHEAADVRVFWPLRAAGAAGERAGDVVWIGNWGDDERTRELTEYLLEPVSRSGLRVRVHGVRYPEDALRALRQAGIEYAGWVANFRVPEVFAAFKATVHVPRGPYVRQLPGIPTIRVFEALACGIPLISAPWSDREGLFRPGTDFRMAYSGAEMRAELERVLGSGMLQEELAGRGLETILARHTCGHRVDELLEIAARLGIDVRSPAADRAGRERAMEEVRG